MKTLLHPGLLGLSALLVISPWALAQNQTPSLEQGFQSPPDSAKPRVWWHWMGGNVSKDGITKDEEWMKRVGIGGLQMADAGASGGQTVENKLIFGTPEWLDAVRYAAAEADRLGLEMSIFGSGGWSETGGPWVPPAEAMKKMVWSEQKVDGPQKFSGKLPSPPSNNGTFQNMVSNPSPNTFYGDSAVVAFRTPSDEINLAALNPKVTQSNGPVQDGALLYDGDFTTGVTIPSIASAAAADAQRQQAAAPTEAADSGTVPAGRGGRRGSRGGFGAPAGPAGPAWVQYELPAPIKVRAVSLGGRGGIPVGRVLASDDGVNFRTLVSTPGQQLYRQGSVRTFSFPETTARFFRYEMTGAPLGPAPIMAQAEPVPAASYGLTEFELHGDGRVNRWEEKAGFSFFYQYEAEPTPEMPPSAEVASSDIINITDKMDKDGNLNWDVPAGNWTILRIGYSLTGSTNHPAQAAATGYEVDKFSKKYVENYFHGYFDPILKALGPLAGKSLRYVTMDSWEAGMQNWTDDMIAQFQQRRGYDPTPYLPALTGRVVVSADVSDRFLWDFRRTIADLVAINHYGTMADMAHKQGLGIYAEASGVSMEVMEDTMLNKSFVDVPMGEFWVHALHPELQYYVDVRGATSTAHAYGKPIAATESFTGGGYETPYTLKKVSDYWFAQGVNRIVFHTSVQQPLDTKPGNTLSGIGTHFNRNMTWAEQAGPFVKYLARNSYMLQQGLFVADVAYLLPEGAPSSQPFWGGGLHPELPYGYDYDCINTDVLLNRISVGADGRMMLPDGMSYRVLVLPEIDSMRPELLRKIRDLVAGGVTVVGPRAVKSPSLSGYPDSDKEVQQLAQDIWGDLDGVMRNQRFYGKGRVVWGFPLSTVLPSVGIVKDFEFGGPLDADINWIHRRAGDTDIYFVANHSDAPADLQARFRVDGKEAELWHSDTGVIEPASYSIADGRTTVPLHLGEREAVFVVFQKPATAPSRTVPVPQFATLQTVSGPWSVSFMPKFGAPDKIDLPELESWSANATYGVKYFSGTATYTKDLTAPAAWFQSGAKLILNLGSVKDVAEVSVNGQSLVTLWKPPYQVDVTSALKPGANQLEIKVTNQWTNRIIGDRGAPPKERVLSLPPTPAGRGGRGGAPAGGGNPAFGGTPVLTDSGLLGPVSIMAGTTP